MSASIQLAFMLEVEFDLELDALVESLPLWPLMETTVTPLTTFEGRIQAIQSKLKQLKSLSGPRRRDRGRYLTKERKRFEKLHYEKWMRERYEQQ